jgi:hypothetical protein
MASVGAFGIVIVSPNVNCISVMGFGEIIILAVTVDDVYGPYLSEYSEFLAAALK